MIAIMYSTRDKFLLNIWFSFGWDGLRHPVGFQLKFRMMRVSIDSFQSCLGAAFVTDLRTK
jgi:hypothetical protein